MKLQIQATPERNKLRVLHIYKCYLPEDFTGIPRVIWQIAEGTKSDNIESHVLSVGANTTVEPYRFSSHYSHQAKRSAKIASNDLSFAIFPKYQQLLKNADILHYHFPWPSADVLHLTSFTKKPTVVTYHSDIIKQKLLRTIYQPIMNLFLQSVDQIVATSPNYLKSSLVLNKYEKKTSIIPLGMEQRREPAAEHLNNWKMRVGSDFFLFIGAFRYYKGLPILIEAAKKNGLPVVIVGNGENRERLEESASDNVIFVGEVDDTDKEALLSLCKALVFPSNYRSEAFGLALLEASRASKPMITCEIGTGTSFVNVDGETGIVVPPNDECAFADAMLALWRIDGLAEKLGTAAGKRFESVFTAKKMSRAYLELYQSL